jgi:hypothetical protein
LEPIIFRFGGLALVELLVLARPARFFSVGVVKILPRCAASRLRSFLADTKILSIKSLPAKDERL